MCVVMPYTSVPVHETIGRERGSGGDTTHGSQHGGRPRVCKRARAQQLMHSSVRVCVRAAHTTQGTNAVVAVISYTGFDMEDAMILNKSSFERGFGHASVVKTVKVDLKDLLGKSDAKTAVVSACPSN
jgi:DNA-directed RNA polymerase beta subunit